MAATPENGANDAAGAVTAKSTFLDKLKYSLGMRPESVAAIRPSKEVGSEQDEAVVPEKPPTKMQKIKRHYRRFWLVYLIILIVILAIMLPITFLIIVPRIAQDLLDSGSIVIDSANITQPRNDSVILAMKANVYIPGPFTVHTEPQVLQMYIPQAGSAYPMGTLYLPAATMHKNRSIATENPQFTPFTNKTTWQQFVHNTIYLDKGALGLKGIVTTHLGRIKEFNLNLNMDVPSLALNQFKGFTIDAAQLVVPAESDGTNLLANATLPNQSVLGLEIGNTTLAVKSGDLVIGTGVIENLYLRPGNNSVSIRGKADIQTVLKNLSSILAYQAPYIRNGFLALTTQITDISYENKTVPYYTEEMGSLPLTAQIPLLGLVINTIKGYMNNPNATNGTGLLSELGNATGSPGGLSGLLNNTELMENVARRHLEHLMLKL